MFRIAAATIIQLGLTVCAFAAGVLENPQAASTQTGVALISGWNCNATQITVRIDGGAPISVPYGAPRADTLSICGRTNTGFGLLINFNVLGPGNHTISALADGVQFQTVTFNVVTLGREFLTGASATAQVTGFPDSSQQVTLQWQEAKQNFSITGVSPVGSAGTLDGTYRLVRSSVDYLGGELLDTTLGNISVTGTMVIAGNRITQTITVTVLGQTVGGTTTVTFTDRGAYLQAPANRILVLQRSPLLITEVHAPAIAPLPSFSEIDQWVLQSRPAAAEGVVDGDSVSSTEWPSESIGALTGAALQKAR